MDFTYKIAKTNIDFAIGKSLILEYVKSLNVDLSFQNFNSEINSLHKQYSPPKGALVLVFSSTDAIACAAIREFATDIAELKRMYVLPDFRGLKVGQKLLDFCIIKATEFGYKKIRLDTLPDMKKAQALYHSMGFYEIAPYRHNPVEGTVFMEKNLG